MTTRSLTDTIGRRLWATGVVLALAAALVAALLLTAGPAPAGASVGQTATTLDTALAADDTTSDDRADLRADLQAARKLEGDARQAALRTVRSAAAAGDYGDKAQKRLDRRADRRQAVLALLPDALQADLKAVKAADPDERAALRQEIRAKALDGGYGDKVKAAAEKLKENWED